MKRFLVILLAAALLLATCSALAENDEKVTLEYYSWGDEEAYMTTIVDAFNASQDKINVHLNYIYGDHAYEDKIVMMLAGGADFDLFGAQNMKDYISRRNNGYLADLADAIKDSGIDLSMYGAGFTEVADEEGHYYGLPYRYSAHALFYNKKIFDEAGLPYPNQMTWEEYCDLAKQLTLVREDGTQQWGGFLATWMGEPYGAVQLGSSVLDDDTEPLKYWLNMMNRMYNVDKSHMSWEEITTTSADWLLTFLGGNVAMLPNGEWTIGNAKSEIAKNPDVVRNFEMGVTYLPYPEGGTPGVTVGGANTFVMINKQSKHFEEAFEFIKYLTGEEAARTLVDQGMLPAFTDDSLNAYYVEKVGVDGADVLLKSDAHYESQPAPIFSEVDAIWREEKELCLIGAETVDEAIDNFATRRAELTKQ